MRNKHSMHRGTATRPSPKATIPRGRDQKNLRNLDCMLKEYDMKRDSVQIDHDAPQWSHHAVWNRQHMEPNPEYTLEQL